MKIVSLILPLFISAVRCSWLCDLIGLDCVTQIAVPLFSLTPLGGWQNIEMEYIEVSALSLVHCTTLCTMGGFTGLIYFPVSESCYLLGKSYLPTLNLVSIAVIKNPNNILLQNVALGKPTYASNPASNQYPSTNSVDGDHNKPYASGMNAKSWWLVDLGMAYDIFDIKLVHRQDNIGIDLFHGLEVRGGNTLVTGPDLTSYDLIGNVELAPDSNDKWFVIAPPEDSPPYQFVSIQLVRTYGDMYLDIGEVYINTIV